MELKNNMVNLQIIGVGILLVIMGTLFSLLGNIGSIIGFLIAITIIGYMIRNGYFKSTTHHS
jgi:putative flippase GtrA